MAHDVLRGVAPRDFRSQAAAILKWVQQNITYLNEPNELIQSPAYTLRVRVGDCDDMAILICTMAEAINLPWAFVLAGQKPDGTQVRWSERMKGRPPFRANFYHIYVELGWPAFNPSTWASAEPTIKTAPLGYDVVTGHYEQSMDRPRKAKLVKASPLPELSGWGDPSVLDMSSEQEAPKFGSKVRELIHDMPWSDILMGVIQGVTTALVVQYVMRSRK